MKEKIKEIIKTFQNKTLEFHKRDKEIPINTREIISIIGAIQKLEFVGNRYQKKRNNIYTSISKI